MTTPGQPTRVPLSFLPLGHAPTRTVLTAVPSRCQPASWQPNQVMWLAIAAPVSRAARPPLAGFLFHGRQPLSLAAILINPALTQFGDTLADLATINSASASSVMARCSAGAKFALPYTPVGITTGNPDSLARRWITDACRPLYPSASFKWATP